MTTLDYILSTTLLCSVLYQLRSYLEIEELKDKLRWQKTEIESENKYVRQRFNTVWNSINVHVLKFNALAGHVGGKFEHIEAKETIVFSPIQKGEDK